VKLVNTGNTAASFNVDLVGAKPTGNATMQVLSSTNLLAYNILDKQQNVYPADNKIQVTGNMLKVNLQPMSFNVIKVPVRL
jgi:alpha-L-arabinofuranosidase